MPFITIPGLTGKIYVPAEGAATPRKRHCPDCFSCQRCSEDRCQVCACQKSCAQQCACSIEEMNEKASDI